jgi:hypothetical protein
MMIALALFFAALLSLGTDFFTEEFSTMDAALFFGIAYWGTIPATVEAAIGRRNAVRPVESILQASVLLAALLFLSSFPSDIAHIADAPPASLHSLLNWTTWPGWS